MGVDPADPATEQSVGADEGQHVLGRGDDGAGEGGQESEDFATIPDLATRQLADDEGCVRTSSRSSGEARARLPERS